MATITEIRDAVQETLETYIEGLRCYSIVPESIELPCVVVVPVNGMYDKAFGRGTDTWNFELSVVVSFSDAGIAQEQLDEFLSGAGNRSIRQTVFEHRNLGLSSTDAHISEMIQYGSGFSFASVQHIGAVLRLVVHTRGTE